MTTINATAKDWSCEVTVLDSAKNTISGLTTSPTRLEMSR